MLLTFAVHLRRRPFRLSSAPYADGYYLATAGGAYPLRARVYWFGSRRSARPPQSRCAVPPRQPPAVWTFHQAWRLVCARGPPIIAWLRLDEQQFRWILCSPARPRARLCDQLDDYFVRPFRVRAEISGVRRCAATRPTTWQLAHRLSAAVFSFPVRDRGSYIRSQDPGVRQAGVASI